MGHLNQNEKIRHSRVPQHRLETALSGRLLRVVVGTVGVVSGFGGPVGPTRLVYEAVHQGSEGIPALRRQRVHLCVCRCDGFVCVCHHAVSGDDLDIGDADETHDVAQVA